MHMMTVPEGSCCEGPFDTPQAERLSKATELKVPMTPADPVPLDLIGLRLGWISKLEHKTEQVCHVMALPPSPEKETELERRLLV
jgi:hypothetical protein